MQQFMACSEILTLHPKHKFSPKNQPYLLSPEPFNSPPSPPLFLNIFYSTSLKPDQHYYKSEYSNLKVAPFVLFFYILSKDVFSKILKHCFFIFSKKLFQFLRYGILCRFYTFLSIISRFKASDQKMSFSKYVFVIEREIGNQFQTFFIFHNLVHKWGLGSKKKIQ